ncbi:hypothetical protein HUU62_20415 [Rhodoferax sp. 4810]|nr:hypothetical protein [Rhodoferax jenense]
MKREVQAAQVLPVKTVSGVNAAPNRITLHGCASIFHGTCRKNALLKFLFNAVRYLTYPLARLGSVFWPRLTFQVQVDEGLRCNAVCGMHQKKDAFITDRYPRLLSLVFPSSRAPGAGITGSHPP